ncbi:MAG: 3'(2'),5'-bisphosphate nucleotidase CysQ [Pseudomonadota bacterium]
MADLSEDLATLRAAVIAAGKLALDVRDEASATAWDKSPGHPVTVADLSVNALLADALTGARPNYGWLSEETADDPVARRKDRVWVVDPIDGTRAYMRPGDPHWCISGAVVEHGVPVAGVIYAPAMGRLYEARCGGGAYLNGEPLEVTGCSAESGCRLITNLQMINHPAWPEPWPPVTLADPKPNATLLRLAFVAEGIWDGVIVLWRKSDWDLAAGALLIEEAGGLATTHKGEPFAFNGPVPAQRSLIAAGKALHPLLVRRTSAVELPDPASETA